MKKIVFLTFSLLFSSCIKPSVMKETTALSSGGGSSSSTYSKWDSLNISVKFAQVSAGHADGFSAPDVTSMQTLSNQWETNAANTNFFNFSQTTTNKDYIHLDSYYDGEMGVYRSTNWFSELSLSALAITQYFGVRSGDYISLTHADVIFNESGIFSFSLNTPTPAGSYDYGSIIVHEMGHFLGLGHNFTESSVMRPTLNSGTQNRTLTTADIRDIRNRYGISLSALTASSALSTDILPTNSSTPSVAPSGTAVRGIIELRSNGECIHTENGKILSRHFVKLTK